MKLLSVNAGYLLDYDGSLSGYVARPHRAMVGSERAEQRALDRLVDVIEAEAPDVVSLVEVDLGSFRTVTDGQPDRLVAELGARGLDYRAHGSPKYGEDSRLRRFPVLGSLANGVLVAGDYGIESHYLRAGPKRLVTEVRLAPDLSLFVVHLAMTESTRRDQLAEIADLVADRRRVIVCGDFNIYGGLDELDVLTDRTDLVVRNPGETVPKRPLDFLVTETRTLDLFLTSPEVTATDCRVVDVQISDHRPIVLEIEA